MTLDQLRPGEMGRIKGYAHEKDIHHRLKELGLVSGTLVTVKRLAPFGDPMEILVRGYNLSIRKEDASAIQVEKVQP